MATTGFHVVN